jgi:excisionase family DNA binding protein
METLQPVKARIEPALKSRGLTRAHGYKLIKEGKLHAWKVGRATLIDLAELDALIDSQRVTEFKDATEMSRRRREGIARKRKAQRAGALLANPLAT